MPMSFPFTATGIRLEDSAAVPALQVADVIASAASYVLRDSITGASDPFAAQLLNTAVLSATWAPVWPQLKVTPEELGTEEDSPRVDPHDYVGGYVSKRLGGIPPQGERRKQKQ